MGGKPLFALNIVAFPIDKLPLDVLTEILKGGRDKCLEANINILGGHSIKDSSPKYGLAATGIIENNKIVKNNTAKNNDTLILTKPLGTGIISAANKKQLINDNSANIATEVMLALNNNSSEIMQQFNIHACTDITGYGLLGHLNEMCISSKLSAVINFNEVDFIKNVDKFASKDIIPAGTKKNLEFYNNNIDFNHSIKNYQKYMLADAQTSGGLLISVPKKYSNELLNKLNHNSKFKSKIIGHFINKKNKNIFILNE